jgi:hypothetical protein
MTTQIEITQRNHHRAVRFFWGFLIGATTVSLIGNIAHATLSYIPPSSSRSALPLCLPSLSSPLCTASRSPSARERPAGFTAGRSVLLQPSVRAHSCSASALSVTC